MAALLRRPGGRAPWNVRLAARIRTGTKPNWNFSSHPCTQLAAWSVPVSLVAFFATQSPLILNPRHIGWLWGSGDISSSFTQWLYFKETSWLQWPVTLNSGYGSPWTKTIVFTDTPPLFALPAKAIAGLISGPFQYTGMQILLSTYLLVLASSAFIWLMSRSVTVALSGGLLMAVSPMLLFRDVFFHYSLNIMWVIPAALALTALHSSRTPLLWAGLVAITLLWMSYFVVPIMVIWFWDQASRVYSHTLSWIQWSRHSASLVGSILVALIINGIWYNFSSSSDFGFGYYNANLLALVNPMATKSSSWSLVLNCGVE